MELAIKTNEIEWWFWAITLGFIILALVGLVPGASCEINPVEE